MQVSRKAAEKCKFFDLAVKLFYIPAGFSFIFGRIKGLEHPAGGTGSRNKLYQAFSRGLRIKQLNILVKLFFRKPDDPVTNSGCFYGADKREAGSEIFNLFLDGSEVTTAVFYLFKVFFCKAHWGKFRLRKPIYAKTYE
ncbi:hypothetical protein FQZ97_893800 [compost metagenome]